MRSHDAVLVAEIGSIDARNENRETGFALALLGKREAIALVRAGARQMEGGERASCWAGGCNLSQAGGASMYHPSDSDSLASSESRLDVFFVMTRRAV